MSAFERRCFVVAVALGLIYLVLLPFKPYPLSWLLKPIPMLIFAVLAWRAHPGKSGFFLGAGFVAAAAGDFFLDYGDRDGLFIQALGAFLINQLAFVAGFAVLAKGKPWLRWRMLPVTLYCSPFRPVASKVMESGETAGHGNSRRDVQTARKRSAQARSWKPGRRPQGCGMLANQSRQG